jgi:FMN phosphatase YigB (HAD superfamily)
VIIDTVMLDYGGVVADHYSEPYISRLATEFGTSLERSWELVAEHLPHGKQYRLDQISKSEFWAQVRQLAPRKDFDDDTVQELWARTYIPNMSVLSLLDYLKNDRGIQTGIVMNEDKWRYKYVVESLNWLQYVDLIVPSFEIGAVKPEKAIYAAFLKELGRAEMPDRVLYVDDRETHVDAAVRCGMQGYVYLNAGELSKFIGSTNITLVSAKVVG